MPDEKKNAEIGEKKEEKKKEKREKEGKETKGDFDTWFPPLEFIETLNEERVKIPKVSAGKEAQVFQALARLLEKLPKDLNWEEIQAADLLQIAPKLLRDAPEEAFLIAATLLDKEPDWVKDNLDFDMIFSLILPFVGREAKLFSKVSGLFNLLPALPKS